MNVAGVSILTCGTARGHDLVVDHKLLTQMRGQILAKRRIPVKLDHRGGLSTIIGYLDSPRVIGAKLLGNLRLLKTSAHYQHAKELIQQLGHQIGLSPAFTGEAEQLPNGKRAARCSDLLSIDLVEHPASNASGLFCAKFNYRSLRVFPQPSSLAKHVTRMQRLDRCIATLQGIGLLCDRPHMLARKRPDGSDEDTTPRPLAPSAIHDVATGALEGGASAVAVDALLHGQGSLTDRLGSIARDMRAPRSTGLLRKAAIGAATGGILTAGAGALINQLVRRKHEEQPQKFDTPRLPLTPDEKRQRSLLRVSEVKNRIATDELRRSKDNYAKAMTSGAAAGLVVGSLKGRAKVGAGIGALAGIGSVAAIRRAMPPDDYGQRTPAEKQVEQLPAIAGGVVAVDALRRKLTRAGGGLRSAIRNLK